MATSLVTNDPDPPCLPPIPLLVRPLKTHGPTGEAMSSRNAHLGIVVGVDDSPAAKVAVIGRRAMQSYVTSR